LLRYFRDLATFHYQGGNLQYISPHFEFVYEVSEIEGFTITWYVDHPDKTVTVIKIEK